MAYRIAHLSDPHFSQVTYSPLQFFSKRWLGNLNLLLFRKRAYHTDHLWHLPDLLRHLGVEALFVTGDFTSTSLDVEFKWGKQFIDAFKAVSIPTYFVPGNHDKYTGKAEKKELFSGFFPAPGLREKKVEITYLQRGWWYIGLDCAISTPLFCSYGDFSEETARYLTQALETIPRSERVILCNHFPLCPYLRPRSLHDLKHAKKLQALLRSYPQVKIYLHGHDHAYYVIDKQNEGLPLILNSGSCAHKSDATFSLIDLYDTECLIQRCSLKEDNQQPSWVIDWQHHYPL